LRVLVERCTCCGRPLTEEDLHSGRCREVGFELLCMRCVAAVSPPSRRKRPHAVHVRRRKNPSSILLPALKKIVAAAPPVAGFIGLVLLLVVMLGLHKTGSSLPRPASLSPRRDPSTLLPPLVRLIMGEEFLLEETVAQQKEHPQKTIRHTSAKTDKKASPEAEATTRTPKVAVAEKPKPQKPPARKARFRWVTRNPAPRKPSPEKPTASTKLSTPKIGKKEVPKREVPKPKQIEKKDPLYCRIERALRRGRRALVAMQSKTGMWYYRRRWMGQRRQWDYGCTALALWALLAAGEPRTSKAVQKGFEALRKWRPGATYTAALILLALEAYCRNKGTFGPKFRTTVQRNFKKEKNWLKALAKKAANYLIKGQLSSGFWTYSAPRTGTRRGRVPGLARGGDASNTQFAMLGLDAACRLGIHVPAGVFRRNLKAMLAAQEKEGPEYRPSFFVPAAVMSIAELRRLEGRVAQGVKTLAEFNRRFWKTVADAGKSRKDSRMRCRGFGYLNMPGGAYLAMTAAGLANLVIAKANLPTVPTRKVDRAIRDAAAWIARALDAGNTGGWWGRGGWNPGGANPLSHAGLYTLLSLERAGVFAVVVRFGKHDWYRLGAEVLLRRQGRDGSWGGSVDTSFALLFLARGVAGVVGAPGLGEVVETGKGLFGDK